jgi:hypothetical protein
VGAVTRRFAPWPVTLDDIAWIGVVAFEITDTRLRAVRT